MEEVKININDKIKVRLSAYGVDLFSKRYLDINRLYDDLYGKRLLVNTMPEIDSDGYTQFQLHEFMTLYGQHMVMGGKSVLNDMNIIVCKGD